MTRKSPVRHRVRKHTRQGKPIKSFERGSGKKSQRSRRVVIAGTKIILPTKTYRYGLPVPGKTLATVRAVLSKIPSHHIEGLSFYFATGDELIDFSRELWETPPQGIYNREKRAVFLRPLKSIQRRAILHEIGHYVYETKLTEQQRRKWVKATEDKIPAQVPKWWPHAPRAGEYYAELYASLYSRAGLVTLKWADPVVRKAWVVP